MSKKLIAVIAAVAIAAAGFLVLSGGRSSSNAADDVSTAPNSVQPSVATTPSTDPNSEQTYLADFKAGYADGFATGAVGYPYPDQATLTGRTGGYVSGLEQGFADGQNNQSLLQERLCSVASSRSVAPSNYYSTAPAPRANGS